MQGSTSAYWPPGGISHGGCCGGLQTYWWTCPGRAWPGCILEHEFHLWLAELPAGVWWCTDTQPCWGSHLQPLKGQSRSVSKQPLWHSWHTLESCSERIFVILSFRKTTSKAQTSIFAKTRQNQTNQEWTQPHSRPVMSKLRVADGTGLWVTGYQAAEKTIITVHCLRYPTVKDILWWKSTRSSAPHPSVLTLSQKFLSVTCRKHFFAP